MLTLRKLLMIVALCAASHVNAESQKPVPTPVVPASENKTKEIESAQQTAPAQQGTIENPFVIKSHEAEKTPDRRRQGREESKDKDENDARLVYWTWVLAVATIVLSVIAASQLVMFWKQLGLMRTAVNDGTKAANAASASTKLARDEFNASHRAWVKCDVALAVANPDQHPSPILFDDSGMYLTLKFTLKNIGTAPATNVWPEWKICLSSKCRSYLIDLQREICEEIKSRDRGKYADGLTIFPNDTIDFAITTNIAQSEIDAELTRNQIPGTRPEIQVPLISVSAIGCIDYRSALDPVHHQTGFAYYISATKADGGKMALSGPLLPVQKDPIPMNDLLLSANVFEGHLFFAD
jgi:hypothetical protein